MFIYNGGLHCNSHTVQGNRPCNDRNRGCITALGNYIHELYNKFIPLKAIFKIATSNIFLQIHFCFRLLIYE